MNIKNILTKVLQLFSSSCKKSPSTSQTNVEHGSGTVVPPRNPSPDPNPIFTPNTLVPDFYHGDGEINFAEMVSKNPSISFVWLKATEGKEFKDSKFLENSKKATQAGLKVGAYHFFRPEIDPETQAIFFWNQVTAAEAQGLKLSSLSMDFEVGDGLSTNDIRTSAKKFLSQLQQVTDKQIVIYGGSAFLASLNLDDSFAAYPLWVAHYGVKSPSIPRPWSKALLWQFSESEELSGVPNKCDMSRVMS